MPVTKAQLLNPIGVSTFNNGPVLIGSATSTGTATQRLQVIGGAYVSANLGVGITNPTTPLHVQGTITATSFSGSGANLTNLNISSQFDWRDASLF